MPQPARVMRESSAGAAFQLLDYTMGSHHGSVLPGDEVGVMRSHVSSKSRADPSFARADAAMARYAQGDGAAFEELYDALSESLFGMLLRLARQRSLAEDLLQQTFLQMHDARGRFVPGSPVRPWAYAIARRLFIDHTRRSGREVTSDDPPSGRSELAEHRTPGDWHDAHEAARRAQAALDNLPPRQREAYLLVRVEGLALSDAADVLGTTVTAVKLLVHRAVTVLRVTLGEDDEPQLTGES